MTPALAEPPELAVLFGALAEPHRRQVLRDLVEADLGRKPGAER